MTRFASFLALTLLVELANVSRVAVIAANAETIGDMRKPHRCANTDGATSYIEFLGEIDA
jgi:hypothetical protein